MRPFSSSGLLYLPSLVYQPRPGRATITRTPCPYHTTGVRSSYSTTTTPTCRVERRTSRYCRTLQDVVGYLHPPSTLVQPVTVLLVVRDTDRSVQPGVPRVPVVVRTRLVFLTCPVVVVLRETSVVEPPVVSATVPHPRPSTSLHSCLRPGVHTGGDGGRPVVPWVPSTGPRVGRT